MPREYSALCHVHLPRPIRDQAECEGTRALAEAFAGREAAMSSDQADYFELLCSLMETWEEAHAAWRHVPPTQILRHLLAEHGLSPADLSRLLGATRQLGPMILRGDRSITAEHARTLGAYFGLSPGAFL